MLAIRYAVEHVGALCAAVLWQQAAAVNHTFNLAGRRLDNHNLIPKIDICPDFSVDVFQFVEIIDALAAGTDGNTADGGERLGADEIELGAAVAHYQQAAVGGKTPPLAVVGKLAGTFERVFVVNKTEALPPGQDINIVPYRAAAFCENRLLHICSPHGDSVFQCHLAQVGLAVLSGRLIEPVIVKKQPLRIREGVVRILLLYFDSVARQLLRRGTGNGRQQQGSYI